LHVILRVRVEPHGRVPCLVLHHNSIPRFVSIQFNSDVCIFIRQRIIFIVIIIDDNNVVWDASCSSYIKSCLVRLDKGITVTGKQQHAKITYQPISPRKHLAYSFIKLVINLISFIELLIVVYMKKKKMCAKCITIHSENQRQIRFYDRNLKVTF
jgi:hypothetical protein